MRKSLLAMTLTVVLILTLLSVSIISLTGCTETECTSTEDENEDDCPFVTIYENYSYEIVYHKDTKVMYAVSDGPKNRGSFTVLVDKDGKPMLYEGETK